MRNINKRLAGITMPICRKRMKWGRNWLCLCGSDKKYKHCCIAEITSLTAQDGNAVVEQLPEAIQKMVDAKNNLSDGPTIDFIVGSDGKVGIRNNG